MSFSLAVMTCLNDRTPLDPMPVMEALKEFNVTASAHLGDLIYGDGTSWINSLSLTAIEFPKGSGATITVPAPVSGRLPTGVLTVNAGGTTHPINRTAALVFWLVDPVTRGNDAWGYLTTNGSGVVTAATLVYGGKQNQYSHTSPRIYTEGVDFFTAAHPEFSAYRAEKCVFSSYGMQQYLTLDLLRVLMGEDHEVWNGYTPGAFGGTKSPDTVLNKAQSFEFLQTAETGLRKLIDQYFHNPPWTPSLSGYVPNGLSGLGLSGGEPFFKVRYFSLDFAAHGKIAKAGERKIFRAIFLDTLFEKSDYTTGLDDATRLLLSPTQEAWLDAQQADAVAQGIRSIGIFSPKDQYGQNSDGWINYQFQWNRILANIQAKNYPSFWVTGDRHVPHAGKLYVSRGNSADIFVFCPTAFGATSDAITPYAENDWVNQTPDCPVIGSVYVDDSRELTILTIHDVAGGAPMYAAAIPWGQRLPIYTYYTAQRNTPSVAPPITPMSYKYVGTYAGRPTAGLNARDRFLITDVGVGVSEWMWTGTVLVPVNQIVCTGTPEGAITAPVGATAVRTDGGAGTTFYVKQSGTGNTGWVAK